MLNYLMIGYGIGMVAFAVNSAEAAHENKNNDPAVAMLPHHPPLLAVWVVITMMLSAIWPWFALVGAMRWLAGACARAADRLRAYAGEDGDADAR